MSELLCVNVKVGAQMLGVSEWSLRRYIDTGLVTIVRFPATRGDDEHARGVLLSVDDLRERIGKRDRVKGKAQ